MQEILRWLIWVKMWWLVYGRQGLLSTSMSTEHLQPQLGTQDCPIRDNIFPKYSLFRSFSSLLKRLLSLFAALIQFFCPLSISWSKSTRPETLSLFVYETTPVNTYLPFFLCVEVVSPPIKYLFWIIFSPLKPLINWFHYYHEILLKQQRNKKPMHPLTCLYPYSSPSHSICTYVSFCY